MLQVVYLLLHACLLSVAPCIPYLLLFACLSALRMPQLSPHSPICSTHATGSLLACLFAPCAPQLSPHSPICSMHATATLSLFAYLLHACRGLSPCMLICSMHAASFLLFHLFAPCMPRALPSSLICPMHVTSSPLRCHPMHAHPLGLRAVGSLPPDPTVEPRSSLGTLGPSPTTPTNA